MAVVLAKPRLLRWTNPAGTLMITDHNRTDLSMDIERIETARRMANGTMRKYWVADKRTFSTSWSMLPNVSTFTVDGHAGADDMENFYNSTVGAFDLRLSYGNSPEKLYRVMFTDFSKTLTKRGKFDMYDVDVTMEEV